MPFTMEAIDNSIPSDNQITPIQIKDGPVFQGYDPKGHTTITGTQREVPQNLKQETNVEAPQEEVRLSTKISALARKEQLIRRQEAEIKRLRQQYESKLADGDKYASIKDKIKNKDYSGAEELGMTYEEYTQHLLNKQASEDPAEQRRLALEEKLAKLEKNQEEQTQREYQANQNLWKKEISKVVSESDQFPTIKELEMEEAVLSHINDSFEEDGTELSAEEAAKEIEEALVLKVDKFSNLSVVKKKYEDQRSLGPPRPGPRTITQQMNVTSEKLATKPFHLMSESEQIAEAYRRVQAERLQQR